MSQEHPPLTLVSSQGQHVPVLLETTLELLRPKLGETYLDLTAGYGGHASRFLKETENFSGAVLVDRDDNAIKALDSFRQKGARLIRADFDQATKELVSLGQQFDIVLVDLGVSSPQLDKAERGFSFTRSGPLDMRMDQSQLVSARQLINSLPEDEMVQIIKQYGEEPAHMARRIAKAIINRRPLSSTDELRQVVEEQYRGKWRKTNPATRTFQAFRIAVNDELGQISSTLQRLPKLLKPGGRIGIISFHSLEDRLVKRYFKSQFEAGYEAELQIVTKKPLDGATYDVHNPRSRSAKLRVAVKK